jgi:hypothetical protein
LFISTRGVLIDARESHTPKVLYRSKCHAMIPNRHSFKALQITRVAMVTASVISADALPLLEVTGAGHGEEHDKA